MGLLVNGQWQDKWYDTKSTDGKFVRKASQFRNWITKDGSTGPSGVGGFKAEKGRYHLYVSLACPWAHRTLIFRKFAYEISQYNSYYLYESTLRNTFSLAQQNIDYVLSATAIQLQINLLGCQVLSLCG